MTKAMTPKEKRSKLFDKTVRLRRERLEEWMAERDEEETALLVYLCDSFHTARMQQPLETRELVYPTD
jgi:hypothetical protein